jgi:L-ascorbate metabolism protein UlaG (beta-lactamase superfamily)
MICAGDRFTMGPQLATRAAQFIGAKTAIPIHWGTWPLLASESDIRELFTPSGIDVKIMQPGEMWNCG